MRYPDEVYGIYAKSHDITFVMKECFDDTGEPLSLEVVGFYYGEPNERDNKLFSGDLKADFAFDKYVNGPQFPVIPDNRRYLVHLNLTMSKGQVLDMDQVCRFVELGVTTMEGICDDIEIALVEEQ
jgi:hypothetical protein